MVPNLTYSELFFTDAPPPPHWWGRDRSWDKNGPHHAKWGKKRNTWIEKW